MFQVIAIENNGVIKAGEIYEVLDVCCTPMVEGLGFLIYGPRPQYADLPWGYYPATLFRPVSAQMRSLIANG